MIKPPFKACKGVSGVWIEAANGLVVANMNDLLADEAELFEIAELLAAGANQLYERENPSAPFTDWLRGEVQKQR